MSSTDALAARRELRTRTIAAVRNPHDAAVHLARLQAALLLDDAEPVQGVLADLFATLPGDETAMRQVALQLANARLHPYVADAFARHARGHALPGITPLATRWSVFAQPSANLSGARRVDFAAGNSFFRNPWVAAPATTTAPAAAARRHARRPPTARTHRHRNRPHRIALRRSRRRRRETR